MSTSTFTIRGMHCQSCVQRLSSALRSVPGASDVQVTLQPPQAMLQRTSSVTDDTLAAAVRSAGDYELVLARPSTTSATTPDSAAEPATLRPLFIIVAYIAGAAALTTSFRGGTERSWHTLMNDFMAGFFLVFSFFKMLDLRGFASAYRMYDLPARAFAPWSFAYPFLELALGIAYLIRFQPTITNWVTLATMLIGAAGVLAALRRKQAIRCACLGTVLNLPMTTVTLIEDLTMAAMAAAMLALG